MTAFAGQSEAAADSGRAVAPADADRRVVACDDLGKRIDGRSILTSQDVINTLRLYRVGATVELRIMRDGEPLVLEVELGERPEGI